MMANEVPCARCCDIPSKPTISGIRMMPPPTPISPLTTPPASPMPISARTGACRSVVVAAPSIGGVYEPRRARRPGRPRRRCRASPTPGVPRQSPRPPCRPLSFRAQPRGARNLVLSGCRPVRRLRSVYVQCTLAPMFPQPEVPMPAACFALFPPLLALFLPPFASRRPGVFEEPALSLSKGIPPCPAVPQFPPRNTPPRSHPSYPRRRVSTPTARAPASRLQSAPAAPQEFFRKNSYARNPAPNRPPRDAVAAAPSRPRRPSLSFRHHPPPCRRLPLSFRAQRSGARNLVPAGAPPQPPRPTRPAIRVPSPGPVPAGKRPAPPSGIPAAPSVVPAPSSVIPAKAGIHPHRPRPRIQAPNRPAASEEFFRKNS